MCALSALNHYVFRVSKCCKLILNVPIGTLSHPERKGTFSKPRLSTGGQPWTTMKNAAYGQQLTLSYVYDIQSKTVNRVQNNQKQLKTIKNCQTVENVRHGAKNVRLGAKNVRHGAENVRHGA